MVPLDINASVSASSSATSGGRIDNRDVFGDFIVGSAKKSEGLPAWVVPAGIAAVVLVIVVWLVRKH